MGSSVLLVFIVPFILLDFIDTQFGTNLSSSLSDVFSNAIDYFVESGMAEKFGTFVSELIASFDKLW
ncbi:MAG: hypothetical protein U0K91_03820 [Acutalibacteraceae bacterium]|nr:hypothetical protein [Clostridia bacterium]MEE0980789.1 hypothetical protein [Acutalibacteraceae bacterium]